MAFRITYTPRFEKNFKKLSDKERAQFKKKLKIFVENPFHPSLRTKRIQGTEDLFEFSVNMDIRVIWYYENDEIVMIVDIGHHDILKKILKRCQQAGKYHRNVVLFFRPNY